MFALGVLFLFWVRLRPLHVSMAPSAAEQAGLSKGAPKGRD